MYILRYVVIVGCIWCVLEATVSCSVSLVEHGSIIIGGTLEYYQRVCIGTAPSNAMDSSVVALVVSPCATVNATASARVNFNWHYML